MCSAATMIFAYTIVFGPSTKAPFEPSYKSQPGLDQDERAETVILCGVPNMGVLILIKHQYSPWMMELPAPYELYPLLWLILVKEPGFSVPQYIHVEMLFA
ncbi:hypothetical protein OIU84_015663 [Salix udensis]|uniref:Uncharacterized protein n=1 Tax=Salix udensis TaxID=889485 RepID=A0AAD6J8G3_9ROSI|nr:hypothetical protein OIU84_015663 [Salix udensis]